MGQAICQDKVIKPCKSASLEKDPFQVPLALFHDSLGLVVLCEVLTQKVKTKFE